MRGGGEGIKYTLRQKGRQKSVNRQAYQQMNTQQYRETKRWEEKILKRDTGIKEQL